MITGPNKLYTFTGQCEIAIIPYINSMELHVQGFKKVTFADGSSITFDEI